MARSVRLGAFSTAHDLARGMSRLAASALAVCVAGALALGCAPGNPGLVVLHQVAPSDECLWDAAGTLFVAEPTFDLDPLTPGVLGGIGSGETRPLYLAQFAVLNQIISRYSTVYPVQANVNTVTIQAAEIELLGVDGRRMPSGFYRTRASGTILSAVGDQPGRGLARVEVVPSTVANGLADLMGDRLEGEGLVTARVVIIGQTQGGAEIRSSPFILPIQLCYGCLYADRPLMVGQSGGCTPGQDSEYIAPGFVRTPACVDSGECASGLCVLGHCARDLL